MYIYIHCIYCMYIIYIYICNIGMVKALFFSMFQPTCLAVKLFTCPVACCPNWSMPALGGGGAATAPPMHCRPRAWWRRKPEIWWVNIRNPNHQKLVTVIDVNTKHRLKSVVPQVFSFFKIGFGPMGFNGVARSRGYHVYTCMLS